MSQGFNTTSYKTVSNKTSALDRVYVYVCVLTLEVSIIVFLLSVQHPGEAFQAGEKCSVDTTSVHSKRARGKETERERERERHVDPPSRIVGPFSDGNLNGQRDR